ncbi:transcription factor FapR [Staphylococcus auricularis]|uniref:transcription factor FapR n=1 Tax=Staphylococcus auricularis TaxID=29379 RepID=UPI002DB7E4C9|nr:transcription factor FapR [Staphylococcus auricularis]MEB6569606.1 transcription factor FapR [Staphylococcus auricularis]
MKMKKQDRQAAIEKEIEANPFITDNELSQRFHVSIQTIRLDRSQLNIPELRTRIKMVAQQNHERIQSIEANEISGYVIDIVPNETATSVIQINEDSVFTRNQIARGHVLFAQANSLCVALIHKPVVLTRESRVKFVKQVKLHDNVHAKARVLEVNEKYFYIEVKSYVQQTQVFEGTFKMYYTSEDETENG